MRSISRTRPPGALYQAVAERRLEIEQTVRFFELEWAALSPAEMERLLDSAGAALDFAAHHLRQDPRRRQRDA